MAKKKVRNINDPLEMAIAEALEARGIEFRHSSEGGNQRLDFFLPDHKVYIEVKQYESSRSARQLASFDDVILIQGKKAVLLFLTLLKTNTPRIPS